MYHAGGRIANRGTKKVRKSIRLSLMRRIRALLLDASFSRRPATMRFRTEKRENDLHFTRARGIVDA